ncbi:hypothetical protein Egran_04544 [Elaphomyces granulatus]|uniref:Uncharacterized protein n=1 Tax=Elaphomyces granulatus TaxID=519963 RepID=A0A232LU44_9EURO|nr:hypothetical protein Egran_04544 [Elaphomyces granulatus]
MLEGRITKEGRMEYQFTICGGISVVFIKVKLEIGGLTEHLDCYAQIIVKCDERVSFAYFGSVV